MKAGHCDMKGYLSFLILWMLNKGKMTVAELAMELQKRKGSRPSPGTIYPALKELRDKGLVECNKKKEYSLSKRGKKELEISLNAFFGIFSDVDEMRSCCSGRP